MGTCISWTRSASAAATCWITGCAAATLEVCIGTDLHLSLPLTAAFGHAQLTPDDLAEQVRQTENHR